MNRSRWFTVLCALVLLGAAAGCSQPPAAAPPTAVRTAEPTAVPTLAPTAAPPSPTPAPFAGLAEWDLVVFSDSSNWGVGTAYAKLVEADRGVKVRLHDCWEGNMPITRVLDMMAQGTASSACDGKWTDLIRDAEVIVLFGNPDKSRPPDGAWDGPDSFLGCVTDAYTWRVMNPTKLAAFKAKAAESCAPETFAKYRADLGAAFDGVFKQRAGRPVILRATDFYVPVFRNWDNSGVRDVCTKCFDNWVQAIHQTAAEFGVPVASTMDAFNGPDRSLDPVEKGYIKDDGIHPSVAGAQRLAEALQQTGYAYSGK